jgi:hypothetical protein
VERDNYPNTQQMFVVNFCNLASLNKDFGQVEKGKDANNHEHLIQRRHSNKTPLNIKNTLNKVNGKLSSKHRYKVTHSDLLGWLTVKYFYCILFLYIQVSCRMFINHNPLPFEKACLNDDLKKKVADSAFLSLLPHNNVEGWHHKMNKCIGTAG